MLFVRNFSVLMFFLQMTHTPRRYATYHGTSSALIRSSCQTEAGVLPSFRINMHMKSNLSLTLPLFLFCTSIFGLIASASADTPPEPVGYDREKDVVYGYKDGMGLLIDVLTPLNQQNGSGILVIHSGGLISNPHTAFRSKTWQERKQVEAELLRRGFVLFIAKHSSAPKYSLPEIRVDMPRAVRFIRHNASRFKINGDRIGVMGGSSGGCLALLLGTEAKVPQPEKIDEIDLESSRVQAVVAYYPVTDFTTWGSGLTLEGHDEEQQETLNAECSPVTHVGKDSAPTLLIHGDLDRGVPIQQSEVFRSRMKAAGAICELKVATGKGHGWRPPVENEVELVFGWFNKWLLSE